MSGALILLLVITLFLVIAAVVVIVVVLPELMEDKKDKGGKDGGGGGRGPTGDIAADVHVLTRAEGTMVNHEQDGRTVQVLTPNDLIDPTTGKVPLKDFIPGFGVDHPFLKRQFKDGLLTFIWNTKDKPVWAPYNEDALKPFNKDTYYFTLHWVRVRGTWFPLLRYDNFKDEKFANDRLVASARVISSWHENMTAMFEKMLRTQDNLKPQYRLNAAEIQKVEELISGKNGWMMENLPTEHFALGGGHWMGVVFAHRPNGLYLQDVRDLQKWADNDAWIPVHETGHCLCQANEPKACDDACAPGHSTRFQQLEWLMFNWVAQHNLFSKAENAFSGACYVDTAPCGNPQPTWLPVIGNANGGTLCVDVPGQRRLTPLTSLFT